MKCDNVGLKDLNIESQSSIVLSVDDGHAAYGRSLYIL